MAAREGCVPVNFDKLTNVLHTNCPTCRLMLMYVVLEEDKDGSLATRLHEFAQEFGLGTAINQITGITGVCMCPGDPPKLIRMEPIKVDPAQPEVPQLEAPESEAPEQPS